MSVSRYPSIRAKMKKAAVISAKLRGCTCDPDVELVREGGHYRADVRHDDWCRFYQWLHRDEN